MWQCANRSRRASDSNATRRGEPNVDARVTKIKVVNIVYLESSHRSSHGIGTASVCFWPRAAGDARRAQRFSRYTSMQRHFESVDCATVDASQQRSQPSLRLPPGCAVRTS